jgi:hypothetical protein
MTRLQTLIKEVLSQPKKKDCNCGCNDCGGKAPILTEGKVKHLISEGLKHHIDKKISLFESVYRIGSEKHLELIREARALWIRGIIEVSDDDKGLLETHLGHFGLYEGVEVPLDLPMVNENNLLRQTNLSSEEYQKAKKLKGFNTDDYTFSSDNNLYVKKSSLEEKKKAKSKKKDPPIGKPKRGGPKAYYVYVRDPKTKRIKKVTFGSGGLRAKIRNPKARKAFAARHRCKTATDRTTARYWSCRLPRYAKQLGLGSNMNTFW